MERTHTSELEFVEVKKEINNHQVIELLNMAREHPEPNKEERLYYKYQADPKYQVWGAKEENQLVGLIVFHLENHQATIDQVSTMQLSQDLNIASRLIHFIKDSFHLNKIKATTGKKNLKIYQELDFQIAKTSDSNLFDCLWERGMTYAKR